MWPHFAPESLFTINNMKWLKKWNVHYNDLRQWEKKARESEAKWEALERGANRRERKCSHQGEYLLIHLRRGKIIDSECMIVGRGGGASVVLEILLPPRLLLHRLSFIPLKLAAIICIRIAPRSRSCATAGGWKLNHLNLRVVSWREMTYS